MSGDKSTRSETSSILYDLSPPVSVDTPVWPGDTAFGFEWTSRIASDGFAVNLSTIRSTVHLAAHADAPLHTEADGVSIDRMSPEIYVGECRVVERAQPKARSRGVLDRRDLGGLEPPLPPRILIKTGSASSDHFTRDFDALSPDLVDYLRSNGVLLVGTDSPSVDPFNSRELAAHHALLGRGMAILEGLDLAPVPAGDYELIALPLRLVGLDASPVRAVLRASTRAR